MFTPWNRDQQAGKGLGSPPPTLCVGWVGLFHVESEDLIFGLHENLEKALLLLRSPSVK